MPTNRPSEDRYIMPTPTAEDAEYLGSEQSRKDRRNVQRQMTDEEVEAHNNRIMERANRPSVIEKLTAPPETLLEHAKRIGVEIHQDKTEVLGLPFYYFSKDQLDAAEGRQ